MMLFVFTVNVSDYADEEGFLSWTAEDVQSIIEHARFVGGRYHGMPFRFQLQFRFPDDLSLRRFSTWFHLFYCEKFQLPQGQYA